MCEVGRKERWDNFDSQYVTVNRVGSWVRLAIESGDNSLLEALQTATKSAGCAVTYRTRQAHVNHVPSHRSERQH